MTYTDLTPGTVFMYEGTPYIVISAQFHRMQMRKAVMRASLRDLITNQNIQKTFTASDRFQPAPVTDINAQYLYSDHDTYYFMDKETFEQYHASAEVLGEKVKFLNEDMNIKLILFHNNPIQMVIPKNVVLKVIEAPEAIKGDSVSNVFKTVICQNNIKVSCPLFIKKGEYIKVDTDTCTYIERATGK